MKIPDFSILLPQDAEDLENRIMVLGACYMMCKQKFNHNPKLHTCSMDVFTRYAKWLKGLMIWGMHSLGPDDKPQSCPHIGHVIRYEKAVRTQVVNRMNRGQDIQSAFEAALADDTLKSMNLTVPFTCDANTSECRALSAPGLRAMYNMGPATNFTRGQKRLQPSDNVVKIPNGGGGAAAAANEGLSKNQKKRARQAVNRAKAPALGAFPVVLAISDADRSKGGKKGAGKDKKGGGLPKGASAKTADGKNICFAYNNCEVCAQTPCHFAHCCWFCGGDYQGNKCKK